MVNSIYNYPNNNGVVSGVPKQPNKKQNFRQGVSVPVATQNDTFVSSKTKQGSKEGMSSGTKWAIGLGLTALVGAGIYLATRGKVKPKQLASHIDFKPAQTLDDAKAFAKQHLGIRRFDIDDLEIANYVNEGFVEAVNKAKGKIVLPNAVDTIKGNSDALMNYGKNLLGERVIGINPKWNSWDNLCSQLPKVDDLKKRGCPDEHIKRFLKEIEETKLKYEKGSFVERVNIAHGLETNWYARAGFGKYHELFHELGHLQHEYTNPQQFKKWAKYTGNDLFDYMKKNNDNVPDEIKEHISVIGNYKGVGKVIGEYATEYPGEFVAEMYAHMLSGKKLGPELMELYKKYGGPMIS